ncbi:MAG: hypothetical protein MSIBF_03650 [Candidatus Altiarchaeales archaeon IMC4]|nr:MAG: hypothetical protein MSIBF_03650 [Candidatus Altiarchaeales archaeon IMC4]
MDFIEPLKYPLKDLKKLVIGGLLIFPGMILLLIPLLMAIGYSIKAAGDTVRGKDELPEFDDWGYFLKKGLGYIGVNIVYGIIICVPLILVIILSLTLIDVIGEENIALMILGVGLLLFAFLLMSIWEFIEMIALVRYGEKENIKATFAFRKIFENLKANLRDYIIGAIILFALGIVWYIVLTIAIMTIIGIIFTGILTFYILLVEFRMFAQIYKGSKDKV